MGMPPKLWDIEDIIKQPDGLWTIKFMNGIVKENLKLYPAASVYPDYVYEVGFRAYVDFKP
jgi:hypothetical protein